MEHYDSTPETSIAISLAGLLISVIIFVIVWIIGGIAFNLFDSARGLGGDKLQSLFRELFVPGVSGYIAMASVNLWSKKANFRFVFFGFAGIIFILVGVYIGFVGPIADKIGEDIWSLLLSIISVISAVVGAYIYAKDNI